MNRSKISVESNFVKKSPNNCISINKPNLFEGNSENLFTPQSIENEGEYIFDHKLSGCNYYNYNDAKDLQQQFDQIEKKDK